MQQDKNFHIRLRAAVEKRLKQHGLISKYGVMPPSNGERPTKEWAFIESLDEITLEFLQGIKPSSIKLEDAYDFKLLHEYDLKDKITNMVRHALNKVPEANKEQFLVNYINGLMGIALCEAAMKLLGEKIEDGWN